jgi:4-amino-4-deoxy-L-arabinose transferase-like glycosyltransferase
MDRLAPDQETGTGLKEHKVVYRGRANRQMSQRTAPTTHSTQSPDTRIAWALFGALTVLYLLIFGGHTYAPDEEMLYYVTEGIAARGSTVIPPGDSDLPLPGPAIGVDGRSYAITGLLQSALAAPLYWVGHVVAGVFPVPFHDFWTRFFVYTLNSFVTGAMAALFYLFAIRLGLRRRTALYLTASLSLATILTVYARTFYSESLVTFWLLLAAWSSFLYKVENRARWAFGLGLALGLAAATKIASLIVLPAFALYAILAWFHQPERAQRRRWSGRGGMAGALGFALPMAVVVAYNYARFRALFETGYGITVETLTQAHSSLEALYGLLLSSGRSIFAYSPPLLLVVWSIGAALRRMRDEAALFLGIAAAHLIFYANFRYWWGGGCWGPRYAVYITPFLLLLTGAFLENQNVGRWVRATSAAVLFVAGLAVNGSTLLVNYERYIVGTETLDQQLFVPRTSPIVAQWAAWPHQFARWKELDLERLDPARPFFTLGGGFYDVEAPALAPFGRWTRGPAQVLIYAGPREPVTVRVAYSRSTQPGVPDEPVQFFLNGHAIASVPQSQGRVDESERWVSDLTLPSEWLEIYPGTLAISTTVWIPASLGLSGDLRELGVFIESIQVNVGGQAAPLEDVQLPPPLPVTADKRWSIAAWRWFHYPDYPHLADVWPWYVYAVGLPVHKARAFIVVALSVLVALGVLSSVALVRALRRAELAQG